MITQDLFAHLEGERVAPDLSLRWYQTAARDAVRLVHARKRGALVCHPTGTGKSRLAAAVAWDAYVARKHVLVLTPTITLTRQMYSDMRKCGLVVGMEQADNRVRRPLPAVTVACVASMRGKRLASFHPYDFDLIVADESHRAISKQYAEIFAHFANAKLLGLTATPDRSDGVSLANVFDELAHELTMLQAIQEGWLVPLRFKTAITDFDAKKLRTLAGEVDAGSVAQELTRSGLLHEAANTLADLSEGERTVAFLPTVASSKAFVGELLARGLSAEHIDASTPEEARNAAFAAFAQGTVRVLSNVGILTEGWDLPACSVCALLNPTKSRSRITQMIGRVTRLSPGKTSALVIDFCPGRLKKGRLASPADALAGKMLPDNVFDQLAKEGDIAEAIETAERTAEEIEQQKRAAAEAAERRRERARELAQLSKKKDFSYGVQEHDARDILGGQGGGTRGYQMADVEGPDEETKRRQAGLCSVRQGKVLASKGLNPWMKRALAREAMDAIEANNWHVPEHIKSDPRFYAKKNRPISAPEMEDLAGALLAQLKAR
jgi:superfamily II DNA or RNA helicase